MYPLQIDEDIYGKGRDVLMQYLFENKIQTRPVWYLNHLQKPYKNCQNYKVKKTIELWKNTLNIPCSVNLTKDQLDKVCEILNKKKHK